MSEYFNYQGKLQNIILGEDINWSREKPKPYLDVSGGTITIEDHVEIASGVVMFTHEHPVDYEDWRNMEIIGADKIIRKKAFICTNVILLNGCKYVGVSSVVGAGSVVTKDVSNYEIWAGNPAKYIGYVRR
jgi:acetyltransferase-like isoleucine patch superfamily enzyme